MLSMTIINIETLRVSLPDPDDTMSKCDETSREPLREPTFTSDGRGITNCRDYTWLVPPYHSGTIRSIAPPPGHDVALLFVRVSLRRGPTVSPDASALTPPQSPTSVMNFDEHLSVYDDVPSPQQVSSAPALNCVPDFPHCIHWPRRLPSSHTRDSRLDMLIMHDSCVASPTPPRRIMNYRQRVRTLDATSWQQHNEPRARALSQFTSILTRPHNEPRAHAPPQFSSILTRPHRGSTYVFHPEILRHNVPRRIRHLQLSVSFLRRPCQYSAIYPSIKAPHPKASIWPIIRPSAIPEG